MVLIRTLQRRCLSLSRLSASSAETNPMKKWGSFNWEDPFNLESRLTDEEKMFRDAFRRYCDEKLMTRIVQDNRNNHFDRDIMYELGELGALGPTCPAEYGCAEVNYVTYGYGFRNY